MKFQRIRIKGTERSGRIIETYEMDYMLFHIILWDGDDVPDPQIYRDDMLEPHTIYEWGESSLYGQNGEKRAKELYRLERAVEVGRRYDHLKTNTGYKRR